MPSFSYTLSPFYKENSRDCLRKALRTALGEFLILKFFCILPSRAFVSFRKLTYVIQFFICTSTGFYQNSPVVCSKHRLYCSLFRNVHYADLLTFCFTWRRCCVYTMFYYIRYRRSGLTLKPNKKKKKKERKWSFNHVD